MPKKKLDMKQAGDRLAAAIEDLEQFRAAWDKLGRPETERGSQMQLVQHPLIKLIREAERAVHMLAGAPGAAGRVGRPPGSSSAPDRRKAVKLRAVS